MAPDLSDGWIVGGGAILRYVSGLWSVVETLPGVWLRDVDIVAPDDVWAVGSRTDPTPGAPTYGSIYHWDGTSWLEIDNPPEILQGVSMLSTNDGWAVGLRGTILHYDGTSWQPVTSPVNANLYDIEMLSAEDGWIVGRCVSRKDRGCLLQR